MKSSHGIAIAALIILQFSCKTIENGSSEIAAVNASESYRTDITINPSDDRDAFPEGSARYKIDRLVESNRGDGFLNIFVREYEFKRPSINPWGQATYLPSDKYKMNLTCRELSGATVNRLSIQKSALLSVVSDYDYSYSVSNCRSLLRFLVDNKDGSFDLLINPSEGTLAVIPSRDQE